MSIIKVYCIISQHLVPLFLLPRHFRAAVRPGFEVPEELGSVVH